MGHPVQLRIRQSLGVLIHHIFHEFITAIASILLGIFVYSYASQPTCHLHISPILSATFTLLAHSISHFYSYFLRFELTSTTLTVSALLGAAPLVLSTFSFIIALIALILPSFQDFCPGYLYEAPPLPFSIRDRNIFFISFYITHAIAIISLPYTFSDSVRFLVNRFVMPGGPTPAVQHQPLKNKLHWVKTPYGDIVPFTVIKAPTQQPVATLIYAHANASSLIKNYFSMQYLSINSKTDIVLFEYPGYSIASGYPEEHRLIASLESVYIAVVTNGQMADEQQYRCVNDSIAVKETYHRYSGSELLAFFIKQQEQLFLRQQQLIRNRRLEEFRQHQLKNQEQVTAVSEFQSTPQNQPDTSSSIELELTKAQQQQEVANDICIDINNSAQFRDSLRFSQKSLNSQHSLRTSQQSLHNTNNKDPQSTTLDPNSSSPSSNPHQISRDRTESFVAPLPSTDLITQYDHYQDHSQFNSQFLSNNSYSHPTSLQSQSQDQKGPYLDLDNIDSAHGSSDSTGSQISPEPSPQPFVLPQSASNIEPFSLSDPKPNRDGPIQQPAHTTDNMTPNTNNNDQSITSSNQSLSVASSSSKITSNPRFLNLHIDTNPDIDVTTTSYPTTSQTPPPLEQEINNANSKKVYHEDGVVSPSRQTMFNRDSSRPNQTRSQSLQPLNGNSAQHPNQTLAPLQVYTSFDTTTNSPSQSDRHQRSCLGDLHIETGFILDQHGNGMAHIGSAFTPTHHELSQFSSNKTPSKNPFHPSNNLSIPLNPSISFQTPAKSTTKKDEKDIGTTSGNKTPGKHPANDFQFDLHDSQSATPPPPTCTCPADFIQKQLKTVKQKRSEHQLQSQLGLDPGDHFDHHFDQLEHFYKDISQTELLQLQFKLRESIEEFSATLREAQKGSEDIHQEGLFCSGPLGIRSQRIILYGRSLGTGVSAITAANICRKQTWVSSMSSIAELQHHLYSQLQHKDDKRSSAQSQHSLKNAAPQTGSNQPTLQQVRSDKGSPIQSTNDLKSAHRVRWGTDSVTSLGYEPSEMTSALTHYQLHENEKKSQPVISQYLPVQTPRGLDLHISVEQCPQQPQQRQNQTSSSLQDSNQGVIFTSSNNNSTNHPGIDFSTQSQPQPQEVNLVARKPLSSQFNSLPHHQGSKSQQPANSQVSNAIQSALLLQAHSPIGSTPTHAKSSGFSTFSPSNTTTTTPNALSINTNNHNNSDKKLHASSDNKPRGNLGKSGTSDNLASFTPNKLKQLDLHVNSSSATITTHDTQEAGTNNCPDASTNAPDDPMNFSTMDLVMQRDMGKQLLQHRQQQSQQQQQQQQQQPQQQPSQSNHTLYHHLTHKSSCPLHQSCKSIKSRKPCETNQKKKPNYDELIRQLEVIPHYSLDDDLRQAISVFSSTPEPLFTCGLRIPTTRLRTSYQYPKLNSQHQAPNIPSTHLLALVLESPFLSILQTQRFLANTLRFVIWVYTYLIRFACCCSTPRITNAGKDTYDQYLDYFGLKVSSSLDLYRTVDVIQDISVPTLYCHGERDDIVPYNHSVRLRKKQTAARDAAFAVQQSSNTTNTNATTSTNEGNGDSDAEKSLQVMFNRHLPLFSIEKADHEQFMPKPYLYQVPAPKITLEQQTPNKRGSLASPVTRKDSASTKVVKPSGPSTTNAEMTMVDDDDGLLLNQRDTYCEDELSEELYRLKTEQNEISLNYMLLLREFMGYSNWFYNHNNVASSSNHNGQLKRPGSTATTTTTTTSMAQHNNTHGISYPTQGYGVDYFYHQQLTKHQPTPLGTPSGRQHFTFGLARVSSFGSQQNGLISAISTPPLQTPSEYASNFGRAGIPFIDFHKLNPATPQLSQTTSTLPHHNLPLELNTNLDANAQLATAISNISYPQHFQLSTTTPKTTTTTSTGPNPANQSAVARPRPPPSSLTIQVGHVPTFRGLNSLSTIWNLPSTVNQSPSRSNNSN